MAKFEVRWKETRMVSCYAEVEADSKEEAISKAQNYEEDVEENDAYTDEIHKGHATLIEE